MQKGIKFSKYLEDCKVLKIGRVHLPATARDYERITF